VKLSVKSDIKKLLKANKKNQAAVKKAIPTALNKTARAVESRAVKKISLDTNIKPQKKIRERLLRVKATRSSLTAKIIAHPRGINLIEFVSKSKREPGAFRKKRGVIANAWNDRKEYKGTFIGRGKNSGKMLVYARQDQSNNRSSLKAIKGPSIPNAFISKRVKAIMDAVGRYHWQKNIAHEINYRLSKVK